MSVTKQEREASIQSLLEERRGYEQRGLDDRVAAVDASLAALGHEAKPAKQATRQQATAKPRASSKRSAKK